MHVETAEVVKRIFALGLEDYGPTQNTRILKEEKRLEYQGHTVNLKPIRQSNITISKYVVGVTLALCYIKTRTGQANREAFPNDV